MSEFGIISKQKSIWKKNISGLIPPDWDGDGCLLKNGDVEVPNPEEWDLNNPNSVVAYPSLKNKLLKHKVRGSNYSILATARLQVDNKTCLKDDDKLFVYIGESGEIFLRKIEEFQDGRFVCLENIPDDKRAGLDRSISAFISSLS